jgi:cytochrome c peroxidase
LAQRIRGAELFARNCGQCHGPGNDARTSISDVKTDELRIHNFSLPMDGGGQFDLALKAELDAIMQQAYAYADAAADAQENPDSTVIGAPQGYANRSLEGVWATAPYLHNGSVASLADLLRPVSARSSVVTVGGRVYDMDRVGYAADSGCGHDYGTQLGADDKKALLEYLKSL